MSPENENHGPAETGSRGRIIGLVVAAVLVVLGWFLVQELGKSARMQDCLMSGRTNCAPIDVPPDRG